MIWSGLKVRHDLINLALDREDEGRGQRVAHERLRRVSAADVALSGQHYQSCTCEDHGLTPGITVEQLIHLGSGCTESKEVFGQGWVCPRLVYLRRMYGH